MKKSRWGGGGEPYMGLAKYAYMILRFLFENMSELWLHVSRAVDAFCILQKQASKPEKLMYKHAPTNFYTILHQFYYYFMLFMFVFEYMYLIYI